jgi:hypothetical protein
VKKKPESSWEESERLGPYQLHEQMPQSEHDRGELYRATHETSGATALVLKPAENGSEPLTDWRVCCVSSSSPSYLAMEVEHSPRSVAPDKQSVETLVFTFEDVHEGVKRMADAVADEPRPRWRLRLGLAGAAAVGVLVFFFLVRLAPVSQPPAGPEHVASAEPAPMSHEVLTDSDVPPMGNQWLIANPDGGVPVLALPFPRKPYKGQKRPPCTPHIEVEIMGACWVPHKLKAPCPEELYEYKGECYMTVMLPPRTPQSLDP